MLFFRFHMKCKRWSCAWAMDMGNARLVCQMIVCLPHLYRTKTMRFTQYLLNSLTYYDAAIEACSVLIVLWWWICVVSSLWSAWHYWGCWSHAMSVCVWHQVEHTLNILSQFRRIYLTVTEYRTENQFMWINRKRHKCNNNNNNDGSERSEKKTLNDTMKLRIMLPLYFNPWYSTAGDK